MNNGLGVGCNLDFTKFDFNLGLREQRVLFDECFPENIGTTVQSHKHYLWKFHCFPDKPESYEYKTLSNNDMVAYYAALPYTYKIGLQNEKVGMVCDVMTSSKMRGRGIFTKLGLYATNAMSKEGLAFTIGYPIRKEVIPGHIKAGWKIAFKLPLYIKFLSVKSILGNSKLKYVTLIIDPLLDLYSNVMTMLGRFGDRKNNYSIEMYDQNQIDLINGYGQFLTKWQSSLANSLCKSKDFLKWRLSAPSKKYKIIIIREGNEIVSMAITTFIIKNDIPCLAVLDLMNLPEHLAAVFSINQVLKKIARENKKEAILLMTSSYRFKKLKLLFSGFLRSPFVFSLIIKKFKNKIDDKQLFDEKNWNLMWVDTDDL